MKLNNLSRLTALLLAMTILMTSIAWADPVTEEDYTADNYAEMLAAQTGTCEICVLETEFPTTDHNGNAITITCGYDYLESLGSHTERYNFLTYVYAELDYGSFGALYSVHEQHVEAGKESLLCTCEGRANTDLQIPGAANHDENCPWADEEYTPSITTPNVSTPDALEVLTEVVLSFTATDATTYTWQRSTTPDVTDSWVAIDGATENNYTLSITPEALTYAYRCVATDADDNVVSTSAPLYLGGETFFAWVNSTDIYTWVTATDLAKPQTVEYILAAYAASADGIALAEAIYVAAGDVADTYILLELLGLTTLADIDSEGNVTDTRYHIVVAKYDSETGTITALAN